MPDQITYTARNIFTGENWLHDHAIVCEDGKIVNVTPLAKGVAPEHDTILPAFIDLQIYGASGKLFSVSPEPGTLSLIHEYSKNGGAFYFQPTVATNTKEIVHGCIDAIKEYWRSGGKGCLGLHVEGPWISKEKRGAHIDSLVRVPTITEVQELMDYGKGVITMITLAPEVCSDEIIELIQSYQVVIAAGHSSCSFEQANTSFDKGIKNVTHLYNAMSGLQHREPGLVGASFLNRNVMASIIADGHHVDYAAIKVAKQIMGDRLFLITDAVTITDKGAYPHQKEGDKYIASGILSGSALTMMQAVKNMIVHVGADKTEAIKMACTYPAKAAGLENKIGKIGPGFEANFIATDEDLSFIKMLP